MTRLNFIPPRAELHRHKGIVLRSANRHQEAIAAYEKAVFLDDSHAGTVYDLAVCYENVNQPERASELYLRYASMARRSKPKKATDAKQRAEALRKIN